jgi:uncharacterized membrane protein YhaH (DUF805 family)
MNALPQLSFMQALRLGWGRLFEFNGRSRRSEYWWWMLAVGIVHIINAIIAALIAFILTSATGISVISGAFTLWYSLLAYTLNTGVMACSLGITVRRLHDCGRTTVWLYLSFILGVIINFGYAYLTEEQIATSRRVAKEQHLQCFDWTERERKEHFEEDEMTELFNEILSSTARYTPAYEANYNCWLEYMYIAFIAHINVPDYDREANDELKVVLDELKA